MFDLFEDVVGVVVHSSLSMNPFFCGRAGEFEVIVEVYGTCIKAIETSAWGEFVRSGGCGIVSTFS